MPSARPQVGRAPEKTPLNAFLSHLSDKGLDMRAAETQLRAALAGPGLPGLRPPAAGDAEAAAARERAAARIGVLAWGRVPLPLPGLASDMLRQWARPRPQYVVPGAPGAPQLPFELRVLRGRAGGGAARPAGVPPLFPPPAWWEEPAFGPALAEEELTAAHQEARERVEQAFAQPLPLMEGPGGSGGDAGAGVDRESAEAAAAAEEANAGAEVAGAWRGGWGSESEGDLPENVEEDHEQAQEEQRQQEEVEQGERQEENKNQEGRQHEHEQEQKQEQRGNEMNSSEDEWPLAARAAGAAEAEGEAAAAATAAAPAKAAADSKVVEGGSKGEEAARHLEAGGPQQAPAAPGHLTLAPPTQRRPSDGLAGPPTPCVGATKGALSSGSPLGTSDEEGSGSGSGRELEPDPEPEPEQEQEKEKEKEQEEEHMTSQPDGAGRREDSGSTAATAGTAAPGSGATEPSSNRSAARSTAVGPSPLPAVVAGRAEASLMAPATPAGLGRVGEPATALASLEDALPEPWSTGEQEEREEQEEEAPSQEGRQEEEQGTREDGMEWREHQEEGGMAWDQQRQEEAPEVQPSRGHGQEDAAAIVHRVVMDAFAGALTRATLAATGQDAPAAADAPRPRDSGAMEGADAATGAAAAAGAGGAEEEEPAPVDTPEAPGLWWPCEVIDPWAPPEGFRLRLQHLLALPPRDRAAAVPPGDLKRLLAVLQFHPGLAADGEGLDSDAEDEPPATTPTAGEGAMEGGGADAAAGTALGPERAAADTALVAPSAAAAALGGPAVAPVPSIEEVLAGVASALAASAEADPLLRAPHHTRRLLLVVWFGTGSFEWRRGKELLPFTKYRRHMEGTLDPRGLFRCIALYCIASHRVALQPGACHGPQYACCFTATAAFDATTTTRGPCPRPPTPPSRPPHRPRAPAAGRGPSAQALPRRAVRGDRRGARPRQPQDARPESPHGRVRPAARRGCSAPAAAARAAGSRIHASAAARARRVSAAGAGRRCGRGRCARRCRRRGR
jgi:hypothetical protein